MLSSQSRHSGEKYAHILAALMLESWALLPVCLSPALVSGQSCASVQISSPACSNSSTELHGGGSDVLITTTGACIFDFLQEGRLEK